MDQRSGRAAGRGGVGGARGFTFVEFLVLAAATVVVVVCLVPVLSPRHHGGARQIKDSANVRGVLQGMVLFAQNNNDRYPIPSVLDRANATVAAGADPAVKDTTSNIMSVLIYGTFFGPEICVSPAESNGKIVMDEGYEYTAPSGAADPKRALWDPGFNADFTAAGPKGREGGHFSYAHTAPAGARLAVWTNTGVGSEAAVGNRGPAIRGLDAEHRAAFDRGSNTLLIHGSRTSWEGNIGYNDGHVAFEWRLDPEGSAYTDDKGKVWFDHLFFDEQDDPGGLNNFLGNFNRAGALGGIWD